MAFLQHLTLTLAWVGVTLAAAPYCLPGEACFPSSQDIATFNSTVFGRLTKPAPYGSVCYEGTFSREACTELVQRKTNFTFRAELPAAMAQTNNEFDENGNGCSVPDTVPMEPLTGVCVLGGLATYILEAVTVSDIAKGLQFAAKYNLRLRVKNTGHDYFGRSTAPGSFTIRTTGFKSTQFLPGFRASGCSKAVNVMALGAGITSLEAMTAADKAGVFVTTGYSPDIGVAGGFLLGGGIAGPFTTQIGFAVDNVVQFDVVNIDGSIESVSECQNPDLFWALSGGGGGFAVVTKAYTIAHPAPAAINVVVGSIQAESEDAYKSLISAFIAEAPTLRPAFTVGISSVDNLKLNILFTRLFNSARDVIPANASLAAFEDLMTMPGVTPTVQGLQFKTWLQAYVQGEEPIILQGDHVGINLLLNSRILPEELLSTSPGRASLVNYILEFPQGQPIIMEWVGGGATKEVAINATAIHPDWRSAAGYVALSAIDPSIGSVTPQQNATTVFNNMLGDQLIGTSAYMNEDNKIEANFQQRFWGHNYERLLDIKKKVDSTGVWSCSRCVGSEIFGT